MGTATVAGDAASWLSSERATSVQAATAGSAVVSGGTRWVVRPGAEVRSSGDLTLVTDWALPLPDVTADSTAPVQAGGLALTLRAAGAIGLEGSLGSGFVPPFASAPTTTWTPAAVAAGAIRAHAGGDLVIGRDADANAFVQPAVLVRNTNGAVSLRAGGDLRMAHAGAAVYTTGLATTPASAPDLGLFGQFLGLMETGSGVLSPFLAGGGALTLQAAGDVVGVRGSAVLPADWAWRGSDGSHGYRWSRFDRFAGGVASFGGGKVTVRAGGSIIELAAAAADSGWLPMSAGSSDDAGALPAGTLRVQAGGDLLGGNLWAAGPALTLTAGGRIGAAAGGLAPDLVWQGTTVQVAARGSVELDRLQTTGRTATANANTAGEQLLFNGLDTGATLRVSSTTGDALLTGAAGSGELGESTGYSQIPASLPGQVRIAAPSGDATLLGSPVQSVGTRGEFQMLAGGTVRVGSLNVPAGGPTNPPRAESVIERVEALALSAFARVQDGAASLDATDRDPVHLAADAGDVVLAGSLSSARPVRLVAGRDLVFEGSGQLTVQHQPQRLDGAAPQAANELSLLQAGRDISAAATGTAVAGVTAAGPGDLVLLAGRDIDLGAGRGLQAIGNQRNSTLLPELAMQLSLLAGYRVGADLSPAAALYAVTGTLGLGSALERDPDTGREVAGAAAAEAFAFLSGSDAQEFRRLSTAAQLDALRALSGADFESRLLRWMQSAFALGAAPDAAAASARTLAASLAGDPLAQRVMADVAAQPAAEQPARLLVWLADSTVRGQLDLGAWLRASLASGLNAGNVGTTLDRLAEAKDPRAAAAVGGLLAQAMVAAPAARRDVFVAQQRAALQASESVRLQAWHDARLQSDTGFAVRQRSALGLDESAGLNDLSRAWATLPPARQRELLSPQDLRAWTLDPTQASLENARGLDAYLLRIGAAPTAGSALAAFGALPAERRLPWLAEVLRSDLAAAGEAAAGSSAGAAFDAAYAGAYQALDLLFPLAARPGTGSAGDIVLPTSQIRTAQAAGITLLAPGGGVNAGALVSPAGAKKANELGIVTVAGGAIVAAVREDFEVNQSRVFTLAAGDIVLWSSEGNVDAGRGAKTVSGAPAPVLRLDADGNLVLDTSGSFSGSGIAALSADSNVGLFAPRGVVNAGEAGIRSAGNLTVAAAQVRGADNIAVKGQTSGDTGVVAVGTTASLAATSQGAGAAAAAAAKSSDDDDERRKRRRRRNFFLDFLGFGSGDD